MSVITKPVSAIIRSKTVNEEEPKKRSREDWRKAKELEEARKAGNAPAAVDEEGKDINPHIPQYISSAPWYITADGPTLKHQRPQKDREAEFARLDEYYKRGVSGKTATRYRKGACTNCGAMTHKSKECMDRPRKVGARFSGKAFAPDEFLPPSLALSYDGKRDRWSGYDASMYDQVVEEYSKVEEAKRQLKEDKLKQDLIGENQKSKEEGGGAESESDSDEDEKYADHADMPGTKVDSKQRITVRNLRIREDVAKYLRNLDPESAYYDPKTRAMRENPYKDSGEQPEDLPYAGENFVRYSGDTLKISEAQLFAWQAHEKGVDVHLQAEPTKAELLHKEYRVKKDEFKDDVKKSILERYGGEEHLDAPPRELILAQSERYVEYSRDGKIVKGADKVIIRSIYEEDVYINNHTSVWGSYWNDGKWGYKCCHSFLKNSYCIGDLGLQTGSEYIQTPAVVEKPKESEVEKVVEDEPKEKPKERNQESRKAKRKVKEWSFMENEETDERKRPYNSMYESKMPNEEEYEEYQLKRQRDEDPMRNYVASDD